MCYGCEEHAWMKMWVSCKICGKPYNDVATHVCERPQPTPGAWICPKCGYVWALYVRGCENCNQPKTRIDSTSGV